MGGIGQTLSVCCGRSIWSVAIGSSRRVRTGRLQVTGTKSRPSKSGNFDCIPAGAILPSLGVDVVVIGGHFWRGLCRWCPGSPPPPPPPPPPRWRPDWRSAWRSLRRRNRPQNQATGHQGNVRVTSPPQNRSWPGALQTQAFPEQTIKRLLQAGQVQLSTTP